MVAQLMSAAVNLCGFNSLPLGAGGWKSVNCKGAINIKLLAVEYFLTNLDHSIVSRFMRIELENTMPVSIKIAMITKISMVKALVLRYTLFVHG